MRGDVPPYMIGIEPQSEFSPRARGCSEHPQHVSPDPPVFPACAGMFLINGSSVVWLMSFPRVRGDVPWSQAKSCISRWFSPRARGCSYDLGLTIEHIPVFPACAGMFRANSIHTPLKPCFPRVRGDVPHSLQRPGRGWSFSPRARGCSFVVVLGVFQDSVFPACAGMFLELIWDSPTHMRFPRVRGDVPQ